MSSRPPLIIRQRDFILKLAVGWRTPQLQLQFTPFFWGLAFVYSSKKKVPNKLGFTVGPFQVATYFGPAKLEKFCYLEDTPSVTFKERK
jgi:hypothetical protein